MTTAPAQGHDLSLRGRVAVAGCSTKLRSLSKTSFHLLCIPCKSQQNEEPTSGLEPLACSLRVIGHTLQGVAEACKSRIDKPVSILWAAACCTVLRSQWYQIGIRTSDSYSATAGPMARPRVLRSHNPPMPVYRRCRMLQNRLIYRTRVDQGIRPVLQAFEDGGDHRLSHRR